MRGYCVWVSQVRRNSFEIIMQYFIAVQMTLNLVVREFFRRLSYAMNNLSHLTSDGERQCRKC